MPGRCAPTAHAPPVDPDQLRAALPDPDPPRPGTAAGADRGSRDARAGRARADRAAGLLPGALRRCEVPDGGGLVPCPLPDHDDAYASCQVYAEAERGWWCFGCQRGGRIYDLASLLAGGPWGRDLRGEVFRTARELVAAALR